MTSVQISPPLQQTCRGEVLRDRVAEWESAPSGHLETGAPWQ